MMKPNRLNVDRREHEEREHPDRMRDLASARTARAVARMIDAEDHRLRRRRADVAAE